MGQKVDGIEVQVRVETGSAKKSVNDLKKTVDSTVKTMDKSLTQGAENSVNGIRKMADSTINGFRAAQEKLLGAFKIENLDAVGENIGNSISVSLDKAKEKIAEIKSQAGEYVKGAQLDAGILQYTQEYDQLIQKIRQAETEETRALEKAEEYLALHPDDDTAIESKEWENICNKIEEAKTKKASYLNQADTMSASGQDVEYASSNLSDMSGINTTKAVFSQAVADMKARLSEFRGSLNQTIRNIPVIGSAASNAASIAKSGFNGARKVVSSLGNAVRRAGSSVKSMVQKFASGIPIIRRFTSASNNSNNSFKKGLTSILKYGIGIQSLYLLLNKLRSALKDGFNNLAQFSNTTNSELTLLSSQLTQLKNSLAAAFQPILTVVTPIISKFISYLVDAINALGQFFAALTGSNTYTKATYVATDYASSLDSTASSADNANESAQALQRTLMGFDEVNKLEDSSSSSSGGNSGSGSGNGGGFTTEAVSSAASNWADMIRDAWENADFTEIGNILGAKLAEALNSIPWDEIKEGARKIAKSIGTFINGFVETDGLWESVGNTVAQGVNTALEFANTFLQTVHWDSIGKAITTAISSFFGNIDWSLCGETLSSAVIALVDFFTGLFEGVDWSGLPRAIINAIKDFFTGFDWSGTFQSIGKLIGTALVAGIDLAEAIAELVQEAWQNIKEYFLQYITDDNGDLLTLGDGLLQGILQGILDGLKSIGTWIKDNILDPFIEGFKSAFGIHSPSTEMAAFGPDIVEGFFQGIIDALGNIGEWLNEHILQPIKDWFADTTLGSLLSELFSSDDSDASQDVSIGVSLKNTALDLWKDFKESWGDSRVVKIVNELKNKAKDLWKNWKKDWSTRKVEIVNSLKSKAEELWDTFKKEWGNSRAVTIINSLKSKASELWNNFKQQWGTRKVTIGNGLGSSGGTLWSGWKNQWGTRSVSIGDSLSKSGGTLWTTWKSQWGTRKVEIVDTLKNSAGDLWKSFSKTWKGKSLSLKITYDTNVGSTKKAVYKALGLSGWPKIQFAAGGFLGNLSSADLLVTRENGIPEMVGRIGSQTAVANNDQIAAGFASAVGPAIYSAVLSAMQRSGGGNGGMTQIVLEGDAKGIFKLVRAEAINYTESTGTSPFPV